MPAWAWGALGHRLSAETAALLLAQSPTHKAWGEFLARHRYELGAYAFMPDAVFRHIDGAAGKRESPLHFFAIDLLTQDDRPADRPIDVPHDPADLHPQLASDQIVKLGRAPWRIEQLANEAKKTLAPVRKVDGGYLAGASAKGDTDRVYRATFLLGLLAHYVADATVPYHATSDTNGFKTGQGGVHFYFESDCVNALEPAINTEVLRVAREKGGDWRSSETDFFKLAIAQFAESLEAKARLATLDEKYAVLAPSQKTGPESADNFAQRRPAAEGCAGMREFTIERLARAAVLIAFVWQQILPPKAPENLQSLQFSDMHHGERYLALP